MKKCYNQPVLDIDDGSMILAHSLAMNVVKTHRRMLLFYVQINAAWDGSSETTEICWNTSKWLRTLSWQLPKRV